MAYEQLNAFTDELHKQWQSLDKRAKTATENGITKDADRCYFQQCQLETDLVNYYLYVLKPIGKFRTQRLYCLGIIKQISPARYAGLTSKPKKSKSDEH